MGRKECTCISVIIPMYNVEAYLKRCLDSVINQSYKNLEIILIDDGSPDNCGLIAEEYAMKDERIKVIHQKNRGLAYSRNVGIKEAAGEWIAFVDSDDELGKDTIKILWETAKKEKVSMSMGGYYLCVHQGKKNRKKQIHVQEQIIYKTENLHRYFMAEGKSYAFIWMKIYHRSIFENIGFPDGRCYEDIYILPEIIEAAGSIAIVDVPIYYYHLRMNSITFGDKMQNHMDGLNARLDWKNLIEKKYPQLLGYSADAVLEFCCYLLGKMSCLGRKENIEYWKQVTECFQKNQAVAAREGLYLKVAVMIFRISPILLGKMCHIYSKLKYF